MALDIVHHSAQWTAKLITYRTNEIINYMHYDKVSVDEVAKDFVFDSETGKAANVIKPVLDKDLKFQLVANKRILWIYRAVATDFGKFALQGENAEGAQDFALDIYSSH